MDESAASDMRSPGADRAAFLARVRAALGRARTTAPPPPPAVDESVIRLVPPTADLVARFAQQAAAMGMVVHTLRGGELVKEILALAAALNLKRVVLGAGTVPQALALGDALRRKGIAIIDWRSAGAAPGGDAPGASDPPAASRLDGQFDVEAGITDVHAVIAETGTLVCHADAGHSCGLSLVPPVHIAIVRRSDILPDLVDYWPRLSARAAGLPSNVVLITGPSKTADIEGILVTGVHGPGAVHVMLISDL